MSSVLVLIAGAHGSEWSHERAGNFRIGPAFVCFGGTDDREIVGQIPDIVLTAGIAQNRTVTQTHVVRKTNPPSATEYSPFSECGAIARSNTPGVSIKSTYFDIGTVHPPGEWAGLNGAHGSVGPATVLPPIKLELIFDGSAAAGTVGNIEIAQTTADDGVGYFPRIIGIVNVYVIASGAPPPVTWFTITGNATSISGDRIVLDHPLLNSNPGTRIFVTHSLLTPGSASAISWPHPVSVSYDMSLQRWQIRNDDGTPMPVGIAFNVRIDPGAKLLAVRRLPGRADRVTSLVINDSRANYNPYATIFVTPASTNRHPIAVKYVAPYWRIINSDGAQMNAGQRFFVQVLGATAYRDDRWRNTRRYDPLGTNAISNGSGIDIHGIGLRRTSGASRYLDFFWARRVSVPLIVTANQTPIGRDAFIDSTYTGVAFSGVPSPLNTWTVRHENGAAMANSSSFNLWAPANTPLFPADSIRDRDRVIR